MALRSFVSLCFGAALFVSSAATAATYDYIGNDFTVVNSPYTTSDYVTGTFTIGGALPDNDTTSQLITPTSYSFSDGVQTLTNSNSTISLQIESTDASGLPTSWIIRVVSDSSCGIDCYIRTYNSGTVTDGGQNGSPFADNSSDPGVWSEVSATPLPAALPLFAGGLGLIGMIGARKRRRSQAS